MIEKLFNTFFQAFQDKHYNISGSGALITVLSNMHEFIFVDGLPIELGILQDNIFMFLTFDCYPIKGINVNNIKDITTTNDGIFVTGTDNKEIVFTFKA